MDIFEDVETIILRHNEIEDCNIKDSILEEINCGTAIYCERCLIALFGDLKFKRFL